MTADEIRRAATRPQERATDSGWHLTSMGDMLALASTGHVEIASPGVGKIADADSGLFYASKVSGIAGDSGAGKSWIALRVALDEVRRDRHVVWIDYEDTPQTLALRMLAMGWDADRGGHVHHVAAIGASAAGIETVRAIVAEFEPSMCVIDSTGEALAGDGINPNADQEVADWFQRVARTIADLGPAVVLLDHVVKADDGGLWPIGSQRKRAAINGVQYVVRSVQPFSRSQSGRARLVCAKDRGGNFPQGSTVAEVTFEPVDNGERLNVTTWRHREERRAADGGWRPTGLMEAVSRELESQSDPVSERIVVGSVTGRAEHVRRALNVLVDEGFASRTQTPGKTRAPKLHTSIKPYREVDDAE